MWLYYLKLSWLSIKKTPILSTLMVLATAVGIGACLTTFTMYSVISSNPLAHKNDVLFAPQLDSWGPNEEYVDFAGSNNGMPPQLTYRDAMALYESGIAETSVIMMKSVFPVLKGDMTGQSLIETARVTTADFFNMFDVNFIYGSAWDQSADQDAERVVVIDQELNLSLFDGADSIGETLLLDRVSFTVVGVVDSNWNLTPTVYDLNSGAFFGSVGVYIPFSLLAENRYSINGNVQGWERRSPASYEDFLQSESVWIQAWFGLYSAEKVEEFSAFIESYISQQKAQGRFQRPLKYLLSSPQQWLKINHVVTDDNRVLLGLSTAFLLVCLVNTVVMLLAKFLRKAPEAGVRRALGASRQAIFSQHLFEALIIGVMGGVLGLVFSWLGLAGVRELYGAYDKVAVLSGFTVVMCLLLALAASVFSGMLPAWRVSHTQPASYLKTQ